MLMDGKKVFVKVFQTVAKMVSQLDDSTVDLKVVPMAG